MYQRIAPPPSFYKQRFLKQIYTCVYTHILDQRSHDHLAITPKTSETRAFA